MGATMYVNYLQRFHGLPVVTFPGQAPANALPAAGSVAWRLSTGDEAEEEYWERFAGTVKLHDVRALIFSDSWYSANCNWPEGPVELLVEHRSQLTSLQAVFLGDVVAQVDRGISWLHQTDVTPILRAYPHLQELGVRGGLGLAFPVMRHEDLRVLRLESDGLPPEAVEGVIAADLPALEFLEMWLGNNCNLGHTTVEHLAPLLTEGRFRALRHLGLQNSPIQDEIAAAVASAPLVAQLTSLSLSMGTLSDSGALSLLAGQPLTHLEELDLHHHYLSDAVMLKIREALAPAGVRINLTGQKEPYYFDGERDDSIAV
ncbi:STM4015 family protein [Streptomyces sp. NPDC051636]|uniref:STM4015 family protein n=1 Tax=Streptomyces sp. NPDC051636 TaxID=3365663 RepID=UPI0037963134